MINTKQNDRKGHTPSIQKEAAGLTSEIQFDLTVFTASNTNMVKTFAIEDGKLVKTHPGLIAEGQYQVSNTSLRKLSRGLCKLTSRQAVCIGTPDQPSGNITTRAKHEKLGCPQDPIPRTGDYFRFRSQPTAMLFDIDGVAANVSDILGILAEILPGFDASEKLIVPSSSCGLYYSGKLLKDSTSAHVYVVVKDGTLIPGAMKVLFQRLWLKGHGKIIISKAGTLLTRTIIDVAVASAERIIYEAPPILLNGITQDRPDPEHVPGDMLDLSLLPDLTSDEEREYLRLVVEAKGAKKSEADDIAASYDQQQIANLTDQGVEPKKAREAVKARRKGILMPDDLLYLSRSKTIRVGDLSKSQHGLPCCDPLEPSYNNWHDTVAKVFFNKDGKIVINSNAHGGSVYYVYRFRTSENWEKPISIDTPALPTVNRDMMPGTLADMVFAVSSSTETPPELALALALPACATACQKKYVVESTPGHTEQLSLWAAAALESGNRKSSVEKQMLAPLRKWEADARERMEPIILEATVQRENELTVIKGLRSQLKKCKAHERNAISEEILKLEGELTEIPRPPQVWEQDITPEHLGTVMDNNNECLGLFSSEGGIFDIISGRYSKGIPNLDIFLQSHSGDPVRVSRGSRAPVNLSEPALSIGISPQPSVIKGMAARPGFRGRGLNARFMYVLPLSPLGNRKLIASQVVESEVYERYSSAIHRLLDKGYPEDGPTVLSLSTQAHKDWMAFALGVEHELRAGGKFEHMRDWAGKLPGLIARIAGVYHCIECDGTQISRRTMGKALKLSEMLIPHALAAFDLMGADDNLSGARKILGWIKRNDLCSFSARNCHQALRKSFKTVDLMIDALKILEDFYYIRKREKRKQPGRPSIIYDVNPFLKNKKTEDGTQNTQNSTEKYETEDFEDSVYHIRKNKKINPEDLTDKDKDEKTEFEDEWEVF